jgi:hypothetical protein
MTEQTTEEQMDEEAYDSDAESQCSDDSFHQDGLPQLENVEETLIPSVRMRALSSQQDRKRPRVAESDECVIMEGAKTLMDLFSGSAMHDTVSKKIQAQAKRYSAQLKKATAEYKADLDHMSDVNRRITDDFLAMKLQLHALEKTLHEQKETTSSLRLELMTCSNEVRVYEVLLGSIRKMTEIK